MTRISIIHPSRARSQQALETVRQWQENISGLHEVEYILSVDSDDLHLDDYINFPVDMVVVSHNKNLVQAANAGAKESSGDILVLVSDDFESFLGWDVAIVKAMEGRSGVLKTFDTVQKWIVTFPVMSCDYYDEQGYFYYPEGKHLFVDTLMTHKADLEKKLIIRNDIVFKHNHYSVKGGKMKDAVNIKADSTWESGEKLYLDWCREMSKKTDIFNLSKEANQAGHVNWLKKKLNAR